MRKHISLQKNLVSHRAKQPKAKNTKGKKKYVKEELGTWALGTTDGMNLRERKDTSNIQRMAALFLLLHSLHSTWNKVG